MSSKRYNPVYADGKIVKVTGNYGDDMYAKIDGLEHFLIYVEIDGVNVPMRLCEWDMENECLILHEKP